MLNPLSLNRKKIQPIQEEWFSVTCRIKTAVAEFFREVSPKIAERPGGYTRILKTGNRIGDNADMCILELVDFNEAMLGGEKLQKQKQQEEEELLRKKRSWC